MNVGNNRSNYKQSAAQQVHVQNANSFVSRLLEQDSDEVCLCTCSTMIQLCETLEGRRGLRRPEKEGPQGNRPHKDIRIATMQEI